MREGIADVLFRQVGNTRIHMNFWYGYDTLLHSGGTDSQEMKQTSEERFDVFTAVTMKNAVFWVIKTQFVPHRKHIKYPLQGPAS
jgi:hypothetical protein